MVLCDRYWIEGASMSSKTLSKRCASSQEILAVTPNSAPYSRSDSSAVRICCPFRPHLISPHASHDHFDYYLAFVLTITLSSTEAVFPILDSH